jgi:putative membrane protein
MPTRGPAPEWVALLNTSLIVISGVCLLVGYYFIRQRRAILQERSVLAMSKQFANGDRGERQIELQERAERQIELHKRSMLTATVFAALFLVVYVSRAVLFETKVFAGEGSVRVVYLAILISHTILAILVGPFALVTLRRALRGDFLKHRQIARITFPMWIYVVVTGWLIYWMLHSLSVESY